MAARGVALMCALLIGAAVLVGCGGSESRPGTSGSGVASGIATAGPDGSHRLDLVLPECSASFRRASAKLVPEMVEVALDTAAKRRALWAACFAGAPLQDLYWDVRINFSDIPAALTSNQRIAERFNLARALGLRKEFRRIIASTTRAAPGSGQLEALEVASQTPGVGRVFMFTDALIKEPEGVVLRTATHAEVAEVINRWAPRLTGLKGVQLIFVGVGLGAESGRGVRNARELFSGLASRIGASFSWTRNLPFEFDQRE